MKNGNNVICTLIRRGEAKRGGKTKYGGNAVYFECKFYNIYFDVSTGATAKNATIGPLAGIEPVALRF